VIDFKSINAAAMPRLGSLLPGWLPGGRIEAGEYVCASLEGGQGRSCSVNLTSCLWGDFATGAKGGDPVSLLAAVRGVKQSEAARELAQDLGLPCNNGSNQPRRDRRRIVASYDYVGPDGKLVFQVTRWEPKTFSQRRPDGNGGWIPSVKGIELVPYRLPGIIKAKSIFIVEGEKDADALAALGLAATCNAQGAGKWRPEYNRHFAGKRVAILPDNDDPGRKHACDVARQLHGLAEVVKVIELPGLPPKGDVSDWLAAGGTRENLLELVKAAPVTNPDLDPAEAHRPRRSQQAATKEADKAAAHIVLARLVVTSYGLGNIRYTNGSFWLWAGGVWKRTDDRAVKQRIHEKCEKEIASQNTVNSILELCKTEVFSEDTHQDIECRFINCINGELHWTGSEWELRPHNRAHFSTSQIPVVYDPQAAAPRFEQFLTEVFRDDPDAEEKAVIVCEALGYSLLSTCEFEKFFLLIGNGANGKSVLLRLLEDLAGPGNVAAVQPSQFDNKFQRAHLHCKLVNLVSEIAEGAEIADAQLKAIVSGELTTVEHKMQKPFDFRPYCTCFFGTNHLPHTRDFSAALFRRAIVLTFNRTFAPSEQDQRLRDKLREELPGVLNLALEGMAGVFDRGGFTSAASVEAAKDAWRLEADQVAQFCEECCKFDRAAQVASAELYKTYEAWSEEAGIRRSLNRKNFTNRICRLGAEIHKGSGGVRLLVGVQIAHEAMQ
jgi:putative DNA primase/helicase